MDLNLTDRVFVVTAASGGLGFATAKALVDEGARVVLVARREEVLAERLQELGSQNAVALVADLAESDTPARASALALDTWDRLDGAMISVGGPAAGVAATNTDEQWRAAFDSVFLAGVRSIEAVLDQARVPDSGAPNGAEGPVIGLVLSSSARLPVRDLTISNGLRPGLANLIAQYATEFGPRGARLFGLLPGKIATDRMRSLIEMADDPAEEERKTNASIPLGRIGEPAEFGRTAAFLLSPAASYISGVVLPVDGGLLPFA